MSTPKVQLIKDARPEFGMSTPSPVQRITPESVLTFPCWLWSILGQHWLLKYGVYGSMLQYYSHYHPNQPSAPTEVPQEAAGEDSAELSKAAEDAQQALHNLIWALPKGEPAVKKQIEDMYATVTRIWSKVHGFNLAPTQQPAVTNEVAVKERARALGHTYDELCHEIKYGNHNSQMTRLLTKARNAIREIISSPAPTTDEAIAREAAVEFVMNREHNVSRQCDQLEAIILRALIRAKSTPSLSASDIHDPRRVPVESGPATSHVTPTPSPSQDTEDTELLDWLEKNVDMPEGFHAENDVGEKTGKVVWEWSHISEVCWTDLRSAIRAARNSPSSHRREIR